MDTNNHQHTEAEARWFKFSLAVGKEGRDVMAEVTKALYAGGDLRPDVYLRDQRHYTKENYRERFMFLQHEAISRWPLDKPFKIVEAVKNPKWDITLHYGLQQTTCNLDSLNNWANSQSGSFENLLFCLKDLRNKVCHGPLELSESQLNHCKKRLENLCCKILTVLGERTNKSYDEEIKEVQRKLHQRLSPNDCPGNTGQYDIKKEDSELKSAKLELLKEYEKKRNIDPGGIKHDTPLHIGSIYNITKMTVSKMDSKRESHGKIQANKILTLLNSGKSKTNLVIVGAPGLGKTMLLLYILDNWCLETSSMPGIEDIDLVLYIDMETLPTASLNILVKDNLLKRTFMNLGHKKSVKKLQHWRTLWLLDGFDGSAESNSITKDICDKFPHVIISVTPEFVSKVSSWTIKSTISLELDSIDLTTAKEIGSSILLNLCKGRECNILLEKFTEFTTKVGALQPGLISSPFLLSRLCILWLESQETFSSIETSGQLNKELFKISIDQVTERLVHKTSESKAILQRKMLKLMDILSKIAWELINENSTLLSEKHVILLFNTCKQLKLHDYYLIIIAPFLVKIQNGENGIKVHRQVYKFFEKQNLDFLAARHIVNLMNKDSKVPLYSILENDIRWSNVVVNFVSIAAAEKTLNHTLAKQVVDFMRGMEYELEDWMNLLTESNGNIHLAEEIFTVTDGSLSQLVTYNTLINNWRMVSSLVHYWQLEVVQLKLDSRPDNLEVAMARMIILSYYVREMDIFCNWSLFALKCSEVVDDFLNYLTTNLCCVLSRFSGHLSQEAIMNGLPRTVKSLSLRLTTLEQAIALHYWLQRQHMEEVSLILDFPQSLIPNTLPRLTPKWLPQMHEAYSPVDRCVVILRPDFAQIKWDVRVLGKLTGNRYHLKAFDSDNGILESFSMPDIVMADDINCSSHQQIPSRGSYIHQVKVKPRKYPFCKYKPNRVRDTQLRSKLNFHKGKTFKTKANAHSSDLHFPWYNIQSDKRFEETLYLMLRLMLFFALWNTFIVRNEGLYSSGYIGLLLTFLLYFIPVKSDLECDGEAVMYSYGQSIHEQTSPVIQSEIFETR